MGGGGGRGGRGRGLFFVLYVRFVVSCCGSLSKGSGVRDGSRSLRWDWGAGCVRGLGSVKARGESPQLLVGKVAAARGIKSSWGEWEGGGGGRDVRLSK